MLLSLIIIVETYGDFLTKVMTYGDFLTKVMTCCWLPDSEMTTLTSLLQTRVYLVSASLIPAKLVADQITETSSTGGQKVHVILLPRYSAMYCTVMHHIVQCALWCAFAKSTQSCHWGFTDYRTIQILKITEKLQN